MSKLWGWSVCLLLWAGCVATKPSLPRPEQVSPLPNGTGMVVGSVARAVELSGYHTYEIGFANKVTGQQHQIFMRHREGDPDFDFSELLLAGDLFGFVLPAGEYGLYKATFQNDSSTYIAVPGTVVQFTVAPGEILYLGEFYFGHGEDPTHVYREGKQFVIQDRWGRDSALFKARYPSVDWSEASLHPALAAGSTTGPSPSGTPPGMTGRSPNRTVDIDRLLNEPLKVAPARKQ